MIIFYILLTIAFFAFLAMLSKYLEESKKYESLKKRFDELNTEKFSMIDHVNRLKRQIQEESSKLDLLQEENIDLEHQIHKLTSISKEQAPIKKRKLAKPKAKK